MSETDLNLLRALDALLSEGSVAGAARRLGLSASAMSRTLARLRATTGDALLVRAGRGMVLTPHAEALRNRVPDIAKQAGAVLQRAQAPLDLATLVRSFTIRANDGFVEAFAARLVGAVAEVAPGVQLRFLPKPDKDIRQLREGLVDLEIGVIGEGGPELRVQTLFHDRFVGVVRAGHPLSTGEIGVARYAAAGHVTVSRRERKANPVDNALAEMGLSRRIVVIVPGFPAALAIAAGSDLVAQVPYSAVQSEQARGGAPLWPFALPVPTSPITVAQIWHPRMETDPGHQWLRRLVKTCCRPSEGGDLPG